MAKKMKLNDGAAVVSTDDVPPAVDDECEDTDRELSSSDDETDDSSSDSPSDEESEDDDGSDSDDDLSDADLRKAAEGETDEEDDDDYGSSSGDDDDVDIGGGGDERVVPETVEAPERLAEARAAANVTDALREWAHAMSPIAPTEGVPKWSVTGVGPVENGEQTQVVRLHGTPLAIVLHNEAKGECDLLCHVGAAKWCALQGTVDVSPTTVCAISADDDTWSATVRPWRHGRVDKEIARLVKDHGKVDTDIWFDIAPASTGCDPAKHLVGVNPDHMLLVVEVDADATQSTHARVRGDGGRVELGARADTSINDLLEEALSS